MLSPLSPRIIAAFTTAVGAAAIGLAVATAGTAGANTKDEAFIAQMESIGVTFSSPQVATQQAQLVCKKLASGETGTEIAEEVLSQTNLTTKQAAYFSSTQPRPTARNTPASSPSRCPPDAGIPSTGIPAFALPPDNESV